MLQPLQNDLLSDEQFVHAHSVNVFEPQQRIHVLFCRDSVKIQPLDDNTWHNSCATAASCLSRAEGTAVRAVVYELGVGKFEIIDVGFEGMRNVI